MPFDFGSWRVGAASVKALSSLALLAVAALSGPTTAMAQSASYFDRNNNVGVQDRPHPDYEALGVDAGGFAVLPSVNVTENYDDNIYATHEQTKGDFITAVTPGVQAVSNWARNALALNASVVSNTYAAHSSENTIDYQFGGSGRLDIQAQSNVTAGFTYGRFALPRTAENTFGATKSPVQYDQASANLGGLQTLNRLRFSEGFNFTQISYSNNSDNAGAPLVLSGLDNSQFGLTGRADYAISPDIALFVSAQGNDRSYSQSQSLTIINRDSSGYQATVGADFDLTRLVRGQVQLGYLSQNYTSKAYHPVNGPAAHIRVEYFLSGLTTVTLHVDTSVIDAVDPTAISYLQTQGGLQVDHELLRNVILTGKASYETDAFRGEPRNDERTTASFGGTYLLNRHVGVTAGYSLVSLSSSGAARIGSYIAHVVSFSLVFRL